MHKRKKDYKCYTYTFVSCINFSHRRTQKILALTAIEKRKMKRQKNRKNLTPFLVEIGTFLAYATVSFLCASQRPPPVCYHTAKVPYRKRENFNSCRAVSWLRQRECFVSYSNFHLHSKQLELHVGKISLSPFTLTKEKEENRNIERKIALIDFFHKYLNLCNWLHILLLSIRTLNAVIFEKNAIRCSGLCSWYVCGSQRTKKGQRTRITSIDTTFSISVALIEHAIWLYIEKCRQTTNLWHSFSFNTQYFFLSLGAFFCFWAVYIVYLYFPGIFSVMSFNILMVANRFPFFKHISKAFQFCSLCAKWVHVAYRWNGFITRFSIAQLNFDSLVCYLLLLLHYTCVVITLCGCGWKMST